MKSINLITFEFLIMHPTHRDRKTFKFSIGNYVKCLTAVKVIDKKTNNRVINFQKIRKRNNVYVAKVYTWQNAVEKYDEVNK